MPHAHPDRLRSIKTLPQLAAYLRDELDWPIVSDDAEDITFDYEPSEFGLDEKTAVRIKEIKQLRPLSGSQPWGIFFVNFEKKSLPVVVMRRLLRALVLKKRASANQAERQAWQPNDLLFISAYGEDTDRVVGVLREVGAEVRADPKFGPQIRDDLDVLGVERLADSGVTIRARIKTEPASRWSVGREFNRRIKQRFDRLGIEIPYPHQKLVIEREAARHPIEEGEIADITPRKSGG